MTAVVYQKLDTNIGGGQTEIIGVMTRYQFTVDGKFCIYIRI